MEANERRYEEKKQKQERRRSGPYAAVKIPTSSVRAQKCKARKGKREEYQMLTSREIQSYQLIYFNAFCPLSFLRHLCGDKSGMDRRQQRRMLRIPWTAKKTNERVLNEANKRRSLVRTIRKRQATFRDHVMRRGKLEHLVTTGKFEGKRSRGRQREEIMD
ncbi:endonuclease-reverse transcriptase [Plakobranchus ocellatus]|uniref:Endonuclease-reverse transcriptase n=1 Tax=Plakobranchus ocellatus TaxID=259542 RepID=A0AAV4CUV8_9GAST|nr:endonuclease-reverse transcriptase [Plakobranchus ocellatus]